jgi:hypothetical protein
MDPLPVLKEEEKDKEEDWTLREDDDGNDTDGDITVRDLWTLGGAVETAWSDTGAAILVSSGTDSPKARAESIMNFLGNVASHGDASETEKPA